MAEQKKTIVDRVWDLFASVKFAVVIFVFIAGSSIIGTVIEQGAEPEKNLSIMEKLFGESLAPTVFRISETLGFMDMYHSWWFITLLVLFSANLIICSLDRLPRIMKLATEPIKPLHPKMVDSVPVKRELKLKGSPENLKERLLKGLRSIGFSAEESPMEGGGYQLISQKGGWTRLGVYITHLSILIILIGAVVGVFFGFNGFLMLREGQESAVAYSRNNSKPHELGFTIRCDDFDIEYYTMSGRMTEMPKDYRSWLTIKKDGKEVLRKMIEVNTPLKYEGYTFYQSSYQMDPRAQGVLILNVSGRDGNSETIYPRIGETFSIPGSDIVATVRDYSPAIGVDESGRTFTFSTQMVNPAVFIDFSEGGKTKYAGWILRNYPDTWKLPDGNMVKFVDYWGVQYTGLQVRKDPGVWLVYLGCLMMAVGLYITFFMGHRKIWVLVNSEGKHTLVTVRGTSNKNRQALEKKIDKFVSGLPLAQAGKGG
jgi:cytochrome c biogenesis protein